MNYLNMSLVLCFWYVPLLFMSAFCVASIIDPWLLIQHVIKQEFNSILILNLWQTDDN